MADLDSKLQIKQIEKGMHFILITICFMPLHSHVIIIVLITN